MEVQIVILIAIACLAAGYLLARSIGRHAMAYARSTEDELRSQLVALREKLDKEESTIREVSVEAAQLSTRLTALSAELDGEKQLNFNLQDENNDLRQQVQARQGEIVRLEARLESMTEKLETRKKEIEDLRKQSLLEFEAVANKLLEEKTRRFTQTNQEKMEQILHPLRENLTEFRKKVEETYDRESKERFSLEARIKELVALNNQISRDANNLTNALKGQAKTQGNWGEMILENILEHSGLVRNREYFIQESYIDQDGRRKQPDVIIKYPNDRHIIVDSKVSLTAYERFANEEDPDAQKLFLTEHLRSLKGHIDNLSAKEYDKLDKTLDFVMLFVPVEPAFMTAIHYDRELWNYAYKKRVILISPTNLIAALKMIVDIWKREYQNANAVRIAEHGQRLYEKFAGFVQDMEAIGLQLHRATDSYNQALGKLSTGKGNLISQAEKLRSLGIQPKKEIPGRYLSGSGDQEESEDEH